MRFRAIVFDLDGTLVDSAPGLQVALNRVMAQEGRPPLGIEQVKSMVGDGIRVLVERACAATGDALTEDRAADIVSRFRRFYAEDSLRYTTPFPGAREALARLSGSGIALGLCTNKPQGATLPLIEGLGLARHFSAVFGGDTVPGMRKPDPGHVRAVLDVLGVPAEDALMVGDSPNDVAAGRGAGLPVIAVTFGYTPVPAAELGADRLIDHFDQLAGVLAQL